MRFYIGYSSGIVIVIEINDVAVREYELNGIISIYKGKAIIHPYYWLSLSLIHIPITFTMDYGD